MATVIRCDGGCGVEYVRQTGWMSVVATPWPLRPENKRDLMFCEQCWPRVRDAMYRQSEARDLRFHRGEIYEGVFPAGLRRAIVIDVSPDGDTGTLRFPPEDGGGEFSVNWAELHQAGKWRRVESR